VRFIASLIALAMAVCSSQPVLAQQDTTKCATITVSRASATPADIAALIADAQCFNNAAKSADNSEDLRLKKALELAQQLKAAPVPTPTPEPEPTPDPGEHGGHEMPDPPAFKPLTVNDISPIADGVDMAKWIMPADIPGSMAPDNVGAFRFVCNTARYGYDDAIVYPGEPGKAHLHMFFGNTKADAFSTYESLRTSGEGSCQVGDLNRSSYWITALLQAKAGVTGWPTPSPDLNDYEVVQPDNIALYYKRRVETDPECTRAPHKGCVGIPAGLRAIFGTNYAQFSNQSPHVRFDCNTAAGFWDNLVDAVAFCRGEPKLHARIVAPACWNGRDLDSEDHQSHLAYEVRDINTGRVSCPPTHQYLMPELTLGITWSLSELDRPEKLIFSSDLQMGKKPGTTFHADYMEAWNDLIRFRWESNCLNKLLSCTAGNLGDGTLGRQPIPFTFEQRPILLPVPERPKQ